MTAPPPVPAPAASPARPGGRIHGIDLARCIALAGMMLAHMVPQEGSIGVIARSVVDGRSAALFAVLAGISVTLVTGRQTPHAWAPAARGLLTRAGLIAVIGLFLGLFSPGIAVILVNYGVLFAVAALVVRLPAAALAALTMTWLLLAPQVSFLLRRLPLPGDSPGPVTSWLDLVHPLETATQLLLTGYYPVFVWSTYLFAGMALGRSRFVRVDQPVRAVVLVLGGTGTALAAFAVVHLADAAWSVQSRLSIPPGNPRAGELGTFTSFYGTVPTNTGWWLLTDYRHSGTTLDLAAMLGTSCAVLGACLLVSRVSWADAATWPLRMAGSMPLTLYTAHVLIEGLYDSDLDERAALIAWSVQFLVFVVAAALLRGRGPLERMVGRVSQSARAG